MIGIFEAAGEREGFSGGGGLGFEGPFVHALLTRVGAGRWVGWMGRTFGS